MKNLISYAALLGLGITLAPHISFAQNYVPPVTYGGPNVIVNMDVIVPSPMAAPTPLTSRPSGLRSRSEAVAKVPLRLRRPAAPHHATITAPMARTQHAPLVLKKPEANRQITSAPLAPLSPTVDPTVTAPTLVPEFAAKAKPSFSAKELVKAAEPIAAPIAKIEPAPIATPKKEIVKAIDETKTRQRELLAKAREDVLYDGDKIENVVETAKAKTDVMADRTIAEIEDIAPSAPKMLTKPSTPIAPLPQPTATLDPVVAAPVVKEPVMPNFVDEAVAKKVEEKPIELAALTTPAPVASIAPPVENVDVAPVKAVSIEGKDSFRLVFGGQSADLSAQDTALLDQVAARLTNSNDTKIQLRAFADGTPETTSKARRLSLTRALTVRSYLLDKGVSATSMDVRALGVGAVDANTPADRVDIVFAN